MKLIIYELLFSIFTKVFPGAAEINIPRVSFLFLSLIVRIRSSVKILLAKKIFVDIEAGLFA